MTNQRLIDVHLRLANLGGAFLPEANLSGADLRGANLSDVDFRWANLSEAFLRRANLSGIDVRRANLSGIDLRGARMDAATDLRGARMDAATDLYYATLDSDTLLADVVWNGAPVTRLNWEDVAILGDEHLARETTFRPNDREMRKGRKDMATRLDEYNDAVLANRQVATVCRSQGLNEHADRFGYRARVLQRTVLWRQRRYLPWLWQSFLGALAGYGYNPLRTVGWYLLLLGLSTFIYGWQNYIMLHACSALCSPQAFWQAVWHHPDAVGQAFVQAITALHGRGFFPMPHPTGWEMGTAAFDAVAGLIIEASFVATFVQRFFAR